MKSEIFVISPSTSMRLMASRDAKSVQQETMTIAMTMRTDVENVVILLEVVTKEKETNDLIKAVNETDSIKEDLILMRKIKP